MKRKTVLIIMFAASIFTAFCLMVDLNPIDGFFDMISHVFFAPVSGLFIVLVALMTWLDRWADEKGSKNQDAK